MSGVNWGQLEAIPAGKKRNAVIVAAVVAFLSERRKDAPALSTLELAYMLWPENAAAVSKLLVRLASKLPSYAVWYYEILAWRWHGVKV
jgi:hypothetical protein